jgi:outer membrane protein TolC
LEEERMRVSRWVLIVLGISAASHGHGATLTIDDLVAEALTRNPEIQAATHRVAASRARERQAGALPDPTLMYGAMNQGRPIPFDSIGVKDFSEAYIGVSQELPFPGKRSLREQVAHHGVSGEGWALERVRRRVREQVKETAYELLAIQASMGLLDDTRTISRQLADVARARFAVGEGTEHDVFQAELDLTALEERTADLDQRQAMTKAQLEALLARSEPIDLSEVHIERSTLPASLAELLEVATRSSPVVREKEAMAAQADRQLALARREKLPDFGASFTYHNRGALDPYYTFGGTVSVPIYAKRKQSQGVVQALEGIATSVSEVDAARLQVRSEVTQAYAAAVAAERILRLYDQAILKQARLSLDAAIAQYRVGKVDFQTLANSARALLEHNLAYQEQLAAYESALARIELHAGPAPVSAERGGAP